MAELIGIAAAAFIIGLSGAMSPGPVSTIVITESIRKGYRAGPLFSIGHGLIELPLVLAIAYGLGKWLHHPLIEAGIGILGGVFLLWMGWGLVSGAWTGKMRLSLVTAPDAKPPAIARLGMVPAGVLATLSNPYWFVWWVTIGAGLTLTSGQRFGMLGLLVFFVGHWLSDFGWFSFLSIVTASGRGFMGDRLYRGILIGCGAFLLVFSVVFGFYGFQTLLTAYPA